MALECAHWKRPERRTKLWQTQQRGRHRLKHRLYVGSCKWRAWETCSKMQPATPLNRECVRCIALGKLHAFCTRHPGSLPAACCASIDCIALVLQLSVCCPAHREFVCAKCSFGNLMSALLLRSRQTKESLAKELAMCSLCVYDRRQVHVKRKGNGRARAGWLERAS